MELKNERVKLFEQRKPALGDSNQNDTAILPSPLAGRESEFFEAIDQSRYVWYLGNKVRTNLRACPRLWMMAPQDSEHVVSRHGHTKGLEEPLCITDQDRLRTDEIQECFLFSRIELAALVQFTLKR
jgi:hypothetical protein